MLLGPSRLVFLPVLAVAALSAGVAGTSLPVATAASAATHSAGLTRGAAGARGQASVGRPPTAAPATASPQLVRSAATGAPVAAPPPGSANKSSGQRTGPYSVVGNQIVDGQGQPFVIHGVDRPSLEWNCQGQALTGAEGIPASDFQLMASWHANTVRIPLNQDFWLSSMGTPVAPHWVCPSYQRSVAQAVANAEAAGLVVILDLHWSDEGNSLNPNVGQKCMADANSLIFWRSVADTFRTHSSVMFELYNEPLGIPWSVWQAGGVARCALDGATYPVVGMQTLINAIRGRGATNVVLAGGLKEAYDLQNVPAYPLSGGNIAYSTHPYEGYVGDSPAGWDTAFGFLAASAPVVATEFGNSGCTTNAYSSDVLTYMNARSIGYTEWLWWPGQCQSLVDAAGHCQLAGCLLQADLAGLAAGSVKAAMPAHRGLPVLAGGAARVRNDFEGSTQGWVTTWNGAELTLAPSATSHSGAGSLGITVVSRGANAAVEQRTGLAAAGPDSIVTYWIYAPAGYDDTVTPFARDRLGTPHFADTVYLRPGWNQLNWQVPAQSGLFSLGLEVEASSAWTGTLALDSVSW